MNRFLAFFISILIALSSVTFVSAHPGKTDSSGGHYNRSTGEYHYHHGYPEHQHTNGECPYEFDDKTSYNSSVNDNNSYSTTHPTLKSTIEFTTNRSSSNRSSMSDSEAVDFYGYLFVFASLTLICTLCYVIFLRGKLKKAEETLDTKTEDYNKRNDNVYDLKNKISTYKKELVFHNILRNCVEYSKAPKQSICGTPFIKEAEQTEIRYSNEIQYNYHLKYHSDESYIKTNKIIKEILSDEPILDCYSCYSFYYVVERCFKYIFSCRISCLPKSEIINELQDFLASWLKYYPALIGRQDLDSISLYLLIMLSKNMLSNGTAHKNMFGLYKYRNDNYLTLEGKALKSFILFCYEELERLDKIENSTRKYYSQKIETAFPDEFD